VEVSGEENYGIADEEALRKLREIAKRENISRALA